ncbi:CMRF35-like molecule 1 [Pygocentrus nattereri]|uniref:CMRF35-like molecule 1 n=1 Tax=Pygocentrus nattereri TaxID=42514 RepID=UPI0018919AA9|nr:CMRF35-like molecule 1 [Pygocentrus nattereri]
MKILQFKMKMIISTLYLISEKSTALPESPSTAVDQTTATTYWTTSTAALPAAETSAQHLRSSVIITVCVCVALLLIGGSALIVHKVRNHMIQVSASTGQRTGKNKWIRMSVNFRMKIISILYLISGPVCCSDVFGYSGGSVTIIPDLQWDVNNTRYICKMEQSGCLNIIRDQTLSKSVFSGRFEMYSNTAGNFIAMIRELNPQDSAVYRFGVGNEKHKDVELTVQSDSCCGGIKRMKAYLGETVTFKCSYPYEFKTNNKRLINLNNQTTVKVIIYTRKEAQKKHNGRFSIVDDRSSNVFSVNISDVREDDGGVYLCGVKRTEKSVGYYNYFKEIQLRVTEKPTALPESPSTTIDPTTATTYWSKSAAPAEAETSDEEHLSSSVIITVFVCVALLLIGGSALIVYKVRNHMIQVSASTGQRTDKNNDDDYENVPHGKRYDISMIPVHQSLNPNTSDLVYENPDPNTNQSDSDYENIAENTNQSDFINENANINSSG